MDEPSAAERLSHGAGAVGMLCISYLFTAGATIELLTPVEGLPDMVFTANAAMIYRDRAVMARFRHPERQGEVPYDEAWLADHGFRIEHVPEELHFEGAGDALFCGDTLFAGYRIRSHARGHQQIGEMLGCRVIPVELVDPYYYHLDTCFCPLATGQSDLLSVRVRRLRPRRATGPCSRADRSRRRRSPLVRLQCGRRGHDRDHEHRLPEASRSTCATPGFEPRETPLFEFVKAGGSAKCLTLRLDGEEAAGWKHAN